ncbi:MAG TPA: hypothetical protein VGH86_04930 [Phenylobacterium sp.]|jgi:hypothetical protein
MRIFDEIGADRRGFIKRVGLALLTVQLLPSVARASESAAGDSNDPAENLIIRSGQGFVPHTHDLWIPYAILRTPPAQGVTLISTKARGHTHEVVLSHDQLAAVNHGGTVSVTGGSHTFVIAMALAISARETAPQTQRSGA